MGIVGNIKNTCQIVSKCDCTGNTEPTEKVGFIMITELDF